MNLCAYETKQIYGNSTCRHGCYLNHDMMHGLMKSWPDGQRHSTFRKVSKSNLFLSGFYDKLTQIIKVKFLTRYYRNEIIFRYRVNIAQEWKTKTKWHQLVCDNNNYNKQTANINLTIRREPEAGYHAQQEQTTEIHGGNSEIAMGSDVCSPFIYRQKGPFKAECPIIIMVHK